MSEYALPRLLRELLQDADLSARQLSRACGFSVSNLSQILNGQRCSPDKLKLISLKICEGTSLAGDPIVPWRILIAHLLDEAVRAGFEPSRLSIQFLDGVNIDNLNLPAAVNTQLGILARYAVTDEDLQNVISDLAKSYIKAEARVGDAHSAIKALVAGAPNAVQFAEAVLSDETRRYRDEESPAAQALADEKARRAASQASKAAS